LQNHSTCIASNSDTQCFSLYTFAYTIRELSLCLCLPPANRDGSLTSLAIDLWTLAFADS
jgi:hypothetical protein